MSHLAAHESIICWGFIKLETLHYISFNPHIRNHLKIPTVYEKHQVYFKIQIAFVDSIA